MFDEFLLEVSFIKLKIKGYLENKHTKEKIIIDTIGIKTKNNIKYKQDDVTYKIKIIDNKIELIRENEEFINTFIFEKGKITKSEYYLKEFSTSIYVELKTDNIVISEDKIEIMYTINETSEEYQYIIEMSEKI